MPHLNNKIRKAMCDQDFSHHHAVKKINQRKEGWDPYKNLKRFVKNEMKQSKAEYYKELIDKNSGSPDKLWKSINEVIGCNTKSTPSCIVSNGVSYSDAQTISETLNLYFCSVASKLAENFRSVIRTDLILNREIPISKQFCFEPTSVENIENQMQALMKNKAIGCDRISAKLLKDAAPVIAPSLATLFNRSLTSGSFRSSWKIGRVTAL